MSAAIDATVADIDWALDALRDEIQRLEGARQALAGRRPGRPYSPPRAPAQTKVAEHGRRRRRPSEAPKSKRQKTQRAQRGQRVNQFLEAVRAEPGITTVTAAQLCGVELSQAYNLARRLSQRGAIEGSHKTGWRLRRAS